jgi:hypothetical protein
MDIVDNTLIPISECTDEVIRKVAETMMSWSRSIHEGAADDEFCTPLTDLTRSYRDLVARMHDNPVISHALEEAQEDSEPETNAANGIFWFCQGWRAAEMAMLAKMPKV